MALPVRTQAQLIDSIAESTGQSKSVVRVFFTALEEEISDAVKACERPRFCGVTVEPTLAKATKARLGRNPRTGEEVEVSAKPASVRVKARIAKNLKEAAPSVQKLRKRLAAA